MQGLGINAGVEAPFDTSLFRPLTFEQPTVPISDFRDFRKLQKRNAQSSTKWMILTASSRSTFFNERDNREAGSEVPDSILLQLGQKSHMTKKLKYCGFNFII